MTKKILALALCLFMTLAFCSCSEKQGSADVSDVSNVSDVASNDDSNSSYVDTDGDSSGIVNIVEDDSEIPEDNPDPVDITRDDASEFTPISYSNIISGETISFSSDTRVVTSKTVVADEIAFIQNLDEMKGALATHNAAKEEHIIDYTEEFFEKNSIIMFSHGNLKVDDYIIYDVVIDKDTLCVIVDRGEESESVAEASYVTYVQLPKNYIENVKYVTVNVI